MTTKINYFTIVIVFFPILMGYNIFNINLGVLLYFIGILVLFVENLITRKKFYVYTPLLFFGLFGLLNEFFVLLIGTRNVMSWGWIQFFVINISLSIFLKSNFKYQIGKKLIRNIAIISIIYLLIQNIVYIFFHIYLSGMINFVPNVLSDINFFDGYRFCSFFVEPSIFGIFNIIVLLLYYKKNCSTKDYMLYLFITIGIFVSKTLTGILLVVLFWIYVMFKNIKFVFSLKYMIVIFFLLYLLLFSPVSNFVSSHIFGIQNDFINSSTWNRISSYFSFSLDLNNSIIGTGYIDNLTTYSDKFLPGILRLIIYWGLCGFVFVFANWGYQFNILNTNGKLLLLIVIIISFFADSIFGIQSLIFYPWIISNECEANNDIC